LADIGSTQLRPNQKFGRNALSELALTTWIYLVIELEGRKHLSGI